MSKYTITIKNLMKNNFDFGLQDYPIFDENYRETLNNNILYYYFEDEIGLETPELFKIYLNRTMNRILPYYNNLYQAQINILNKDLFNNVNYTEESSRSINSSSNSNNKGKGLYQDTPQGSIDMTEFENQHYATNLTMNSNQDSNTGSSTDDYIRTITGNNGNRYPIELLNEVKNNLMNIDNLIIDELKDLFMGIY
ncbi:MAG: hypothetical protein VZR33_05780 [Methanosphaera sp.]|nr:hypothetical protein [Methanosphaera sp.]